MNMLARNTPVKGSHQVVTDSVIEPQSAALRPQPQTAPPTPAPAQPQRLDPQHPHPVASPRPGPATSVISAALSVIGRLESAGDIQIDGKVEGEIRGQAIKIGSAAVIKGTIVGENVELAGTVEGKIEARSAHLAKTAHITGDIIYQSLQIDQGAYFDGTSRPTFGKNTSKTTPAADVSVPSDSTIQ